MSDIQDSPKPIEFVEPAPVAERIAAAAQSPADAHLEFSIFEDGRDIDGNGKQAYSFDVNYHGYVFQCRYLTEDEQEYVAAEDSAIESAMSSIKTMKPREAKALGFDTAKRSRDKDRWIVEAAVLGWSSESHKLPEFTAENRDAVGKSCWAFVAMSIYQESLMGRSQGAATNF